LTETRDHYTMGADCVFADSVTNDSDTDSIRLPVAWHNMISRRYGTGACNEEEHSLVFSAVERKN